MVDDAVRVRFRASVQAGELEVEGPEHFVEGFRETIDALCARVVSEAVPAAAKGGRELAQAGVRRGVSPDDFAEAFLGLPNGTSGTDQILVAGYFTGRGSADGTFATNEANRLLVEQAVKLSNPSQSMRNNLSAKRVFKVGNRYRVSKTGEDYLRTLIGR